MTSELQGLRSYRRQVSIWWWLRKRTYFVFVMRELSSIFIGWLVLYLLLLIAAVGRGDHAYRDFLDFAANPVVVAVNAIALLFVLVHVVTWFNLTPQAMVLKVRGRKVPGAAILAGQYVGLVLVSAFVYWLVTR